METIIMEIKGAAGGDEANIFAGDLYRMYTKYAESKKWKIDILESTKSDRGGFSKIVFAIKGDNAYQLLQFEGGIHRVQRVPKTEARGRLQTSTVTVVCEPEVKETEINIPQTDLIVETHRASGAGGQHINKTNSAVKITHKPTGIVANCQDGRSQHDNKRMAMQLIRSRVYNYYNKQKQQERVKNKKLQAGSGDRAEKIRTYNYPQNRITDHRINFTFNQLDKIMDGKIDRLINELQILRK